MADNITTALDVLPQLTADARPLPQNTTLPANNPFVNQLVNILSQSAAQAPPTTLPAQPLDLVGLSETQPVQLADGKSLPLDGKALPPEVDKALALLKGRGEAALAEGSQAELESAPALALHLFARDIKQQPTVPVGTPLGVTANPNSQELQQAPIDLEPTVAAPVPLAVTESVLTALTREAGTAAPLPAIDPQQLLDKRLAGLNSPSSSRSGQPSHAASVHANLDLPTLPEVTSRAAPQAQGLPFDVRTFDGSAPLPPGLEEGKGLQAKLNMPDPSVLEARGSFNTSTLNQNGLQIPTTARGEPLLQLPHHALNDPQWSQAMGNRLNWMVQQGVQTASIQLVPEELGQIQVKLSMVGDMANIEFHARHKHTSELIENMLPRLMAALDVQGVRVEEVKVSQGSLADQQQALAQHAERQGNNGQDGDREGTASALLTDTDGGLIEAGGSMDLAAQMGLSLVDAYA